MPRLKPAVSQGQVVFVTLWPDKIAHMIRVIEVDGNTWTLFSWVLFRAELWTNLAT